MAHVPQAVRVAGPPEGQQFRRFIRSVSDRNSRYVRAIVETICVLPLGAWSPVSHSSDTCRACTMADQVSSPVGRSYVLTKSSQTPLDGAGLSPSTGTDEARSEYAAGMGWT
jgi:hypothetical protein